MRKHIDFLITVALATALFINCKKHPDQRPIANAGIDQTLILPTDSVLLMGYGRDANGIVASLSYKWTKISGPGSISIVQPYNVITIVRNLAEGSYQFELKVTNASGQSAKDYVTINVLRGGSPAFLNSIGSLSINRWGVAAANAGKKIVFAGGSWGEINPQVYSRVDIYDTSSRGWSTAELSEARVGIGAVTVGNKILFAGGAKDFDYNIGWHDLSTRVDIYDAVTNTWTTTELPGEQLFLWGYGVAAAVGTKAYFYSYYGNVNNVIYVFDVASHSWSTLLMNGPARYAIGIGALDNEIFFGGGRDLDNGIYMNRVDIYNSGTNGWAVSALIEHRELVKSTAVGNKVIFAGGQNPVGNHKSTVDIYDNATQSWSVAQLSRSTVLAGAVSIGQKALFLEGHIVDIYDRPSNTWLAININISIEHDSSVIIASGNSVYIAGAKANGAWANHIWKLEL